MLNGEEMDIAEKKLNDERREAIRKVKSNLHTFLILEAKSHRLLPIDATTAIVLEAAACVCAVSQMHGNPEIAVHFLNTFEERIAKAMIKLVADLLMESARDQAD